MTLAIWVAGAVSLAAWAVLVMARHGFWRADQRLADAGPRDYWPRVVAVIPARNEAETIGITVRSLLDQDYPGDLRVVVVDDNSDDGTAAAAGQSPRLSVVSGAPLAAGWSGKLWAVSQGIAMAEDLAPDARYLLLTDADIDHQRGNVARLVDKAERDGLHLVSLMVKLRAESFWERWLIPAFVFFFQKLYPFPAVNDPRCPMAAAAGGCMLVRRDTLAAADGIAAIRDRLIDDCALARLIKAHGPIWLGLATRTRSLRAYARLGEIWNMVARTAFVQLDHSIWQLIGAVAGMAMVYLAPPLALVAGAAAGEWPAMGLGLAAWALMVVAYAPTLALYDQSPLRGLALPMVAALYTLMTVSSALRHWRGRGGGWKGRHYGSG